LFSNGPVYVDPSVVGFVPVPQLSVKFCWVTRNCFPVPTPPWISPVFVLCNVFPANPCFPASFPPCLTRRFLRRGLLVYRSFACPAALVLAAFFGPLRNRHPEVVLLCLFWPPLGSLNLFWHCIWAFFCFLSLNHFPPTIFWVGIWFPSRSVSDCPVLMVAHLLLPAPVQAFFSCL